MRRALITSVLLHVALFGAFWVGVPDFGERLPVEDAISVEIVAEPATTPPAPPKAAPAAAAPLPPRQAASPPPPPPPAPEPEPPPKPPEPAKVAQAEPPPPPPTPPAPEKAPVLEPSRPEPRPEPPKEPVPPKPPEARVEAPPPPRSKPEPPKEPEKPKVAEKPPEPEKPKPPPPEKSPQQVAAKPPEKPREALQPPKPDAKAPDALDALLRSVEEQQKRAKADDRREGKGSAQQTGTARSTPTESAEQQAAAVNALVASARRQLEACWSVPAGLAGADDVDSFEVNVRLKPDGTAEGVAVVDQGRLGADPLFRTVAESAQRAAWRCKLSLPPERYDLWRNMIIAFDPKRAITG